MVLHGIVLYLTVLHGIALLGSARGLYLARHLSTLYIHYIHYIIIGGVVVVVERLESPVYVWRGLLFGFEKRTFPLPMYMN